MANRIRSIFASIQLDTDQYLKGLKDAQKEADAFSKKFQPVTKAMDSAGKAFTAAGVGITAVGAGFGIMAKQSLDAADALDEMSARTGASVEVLSAVGYHAKQAGASMDSVEKAFKASSKVMEDAATGSKSAADSLAKLGLSSRELFAMNVDQRFFAIGDALNDIKDPGEKAALSMEVLGRAGTDLIPIMGTVAGGVDSVVGSAREFGGVMSEEGTKAAGEFNDALDNLSTSITGIFNAMVSSGLLPAITDFVNGVAQIIAKVTQANPLLVSIGAAIGGIALVLGPAVAGVGLLLTGLSGALPVITGVGAAISTTATAVGALLPTVSALGVAFAATATAVVGVTAALGVGIGMLANYAIKAAGLQDDLDKYTGTLFSGRLSTANAQLAESTLKLSQRLESVGIFIDRGTDSVEEWNKRVTQAARDSGAFTVSLTKTGSAAKKAADEIMAINDSVDFFTSRASGRSTGIGQVLEDQFNKAKEAAEELKKSVEAHQEDLRERMELDYDHAMKLQEAFADLKRKSELDAQQDLFEQMERDYQAAMDMQKGLAALRLSDQEALRAQMEADYQAVMDLQAGLDKLRRDEAAALKKAAEDNRKELDDAIKDVSQSAGEIFDAMFIKGEGVFNSLRNALKGGALSIGRSIFQDIVGELGGPIKKAFDDFFEGLLKSTGIRNFISGLGSQLAGVLGKIPGLGGVFGGGGAGVGAGATGAGVGGGSAAVGAFFTNPWTIAIGAGIVAVTSILKSQAHHEANTFVQKFQNPFHQALAGVVDAFNAANSAGELTIEEAQEARRQTAALWEEFSRQADEFAKGGKDELKVVTQMYQHLKPLANQILLDMDLAIAALPEPVADVADAVEEVGRTVRVTVGDMDKMTRAAFDAINPIRGLADALDDLGDAARSPSGGGGSTRSGSSSTAPKFTEFMIQDTSGRVSTVKTQKPYTRDEYQRLLPPGFQIIEKAAPAINEKEVGVGFYKFHNFRVAIPGVTGIQQFKTSEAYTKDEYKRLLPPGSAVIDAFDKGVASVQRTGPYLLHKDERVLTAEDNKGLLPALHAILTELKKGHVIVMDTSDAAKSLSYHTERRSGRLISSGQRS